MTETIPPLNIIIPPEWNGRTVDSFLRQKMLFSRTFIRQLKKTNGILVNENPVWTNYRLQTTEQLKIIFQPATQAIIPQSLPLDIIYEDPDLIVINKRPGMLVHPVHNQTEGTIANALLGYWQDRNSSASFHPVHRLDKLTSGLVLIAKSAWAHQQLALQLHDGTFHRLYLAICHGVPERLHSKITAPLKETQYVMRREVAAEGKPSSTVYHVLKGFKTASLVAVRILSGRTHQIRVHFHHIGHSLWGDPLYGEDDPLFPRPALHATRVVFTHPRTGKRVRLQVDLPEDIQLLLSRFQ